MGYKIKTINKISPEGLAFFKDNYEVGNEVNQPDAILVRSSQVNTVEYPSVLAVGRAGAGVNNITVPEATAKGVCVFNTPGANANAVAELVFIMLGTVARKISQSIQFTQSLVSETSDEILNEKVEANKSKYKGFELAGKKLAVVGLGKIGVKVANYGVHHDMDVIAYDPFPTISNIHMLSSNVTIVKTIAELVEGADVITVHVPLTEKTKGIISTSEIKAMKAGGIICNYARKGIVDDGAVLTALEQDQLLSYITDFPSLKLLAQPKVICTPHLGASTAESEDNCALMIAQEIKDYLELGTVINSVNFPVIEMPRQKSTLSRLVVINKDVPNMIAHVTGIIGAAGVNIQSLANESNGKIGYNLIDFDSVLPQQVVDKISQIENVIKVRLISF